VNVTMADFFAQIGTLRSGDVFGEQSLLLGKPRGATIVTGTECILLQITKEEISPLLRLTPALTVSLAQMLVDRNAQNKQRANQQAAAMGGMGGGGGGGGDGGDHAYETATAAAAERNRMTRQLGAKMVAEICRGYGIALARVRMEGLDYSDEDDDDDPALTPTKRASHTSNATAGRAARHAARLDKEIAQVREAREQYMAALAAADGKRLEQAYQAGREDNGELAPAEQERRRQNLTRYDAKLLAVDKAKRAAVYELHRQLSAAALTSAQTGSGEKWVEAQARIDPRIQGHSIDEVFDVVSRQKSSASLLQRGGGGRRSASAPRLRPPPPVPSSSASGGGSVFSRLSRSSSSSERPQGLGLTGMGGGAGGAGAGGGAGRRTRRASVSGVGTLLRSSFDGARVGGLSGGATAAAEAWSGME
jgi:CRP-like cAMP-binding protein